MKMRSLEATSRSTAREPMRRVIRDHVDHQAATRPAAAYLVAPETGRTMSFGSLRSASLRLAAFLRRRDIDLDRHGGERQRQMGGYPDGVFDLGAERARLGGESGQRGERDLIEW